MVEHGASDLAPGLTQVVQAGTELVLSDNDDNEFSIKAVEHPATIEFIKAFDEWHLLRKGGQASEGIVTALWAAVERHFNNLPMHIQRELPSVRQALGSVGVKVTGHSHD